MAGFFPGDSPNCATAHYFYSLLPPLPKLMTFLFPPPPPPRFRSTCDDDATSTVILLRRSIPLRSQTLRKVFFVVPLPRFSPPSFVSFFGISDPLFRPFSDPYRRPFSESDLNFFRSGLFPPKSADRFGWRLDRALHTFYSLSASLRPQIITLPLPFCHSSLPLPLVPGRNEGERKESELHNRGKSGFGHRSSYGANLGRQRCG